MAVADRGLLPVSIGGRRYKALLGEYERGLVPWQRQPVDDGAEAGLSTLNTYGAWRRFQNDWSEGAGQKTFDRPDDSRRRAFNSEGVELAEDGVSIMGGWVDVAGLQSWLSLDGSGGVQRVTSSADTPSDNLDVRWIGKADDWTNGDQVLACQWDEATDDRIWLFYLTSAGLKLEISSDGTSGTVTSASVAHSFTANQKTGVRVTWDSATGDVEFFEADNPDSPMGGGGEGWTSIGTGTAGTAALHGGPVNAEVGSKNDGLDWFFAGEVYSLTVLEDPSNVIKYFGRFDVVAPGADTAWAGGTATWNLAALGASIQGAASEVNDPVQSATTIGDTDGQYWTYVATGKAAAAHNQSFDPEFWDSVGWPGTADIGHLAAGGGFAYAVEEDAGEIYRATAESQNIPHFLSWATLAGAEKVFYVNGRLLAFVSTDEEIQELDSAGLASGDPVDMDMNVEELVDSPFGIYALGHDDRQGSRRGVVKRIPVADDGSLGVATVAAEFPVGENVLSAVSLSNFMILGTSVGIRYAQVAGDGTITYGPFLRLGHSLSGELHKNYSAFSLAATSDRVWYAAWENGSSEAGPVGWVKLDDFVSTLAPPSQTFTGKTSNKQGDVIAAYEASFVGEEATIMHCDGLVVRELARDPGRVASSGVLGASGTMVTGWIGYGIPDNKVPVSLSIKHSPLAADASIEVWIETEGQAETNVGIADVDGATNTEIALSGLVGERFRIRFELVNPPVQDAGATILERWTLRSLPVPRRTKQFSVALVLRETVVGDSPRSVEVTFDPRAEMQALEQMAEDRVPVTYEEGDQSFRVVVDDVSLPADSNREWTGRNEFPQGVVEVTLLSVD